jgi:hypothetical protein
VMYAATEFGGLYKSVNGGDTWQHLDGHRPVATWDVKVNPADSNWPTRIGSTTAACHRPGTNVAPTAVRLDASVPPRCGPPFLRKRWRPTEPRSHAIDRLNSNRTYRHQLRPRDQYKRRRDRTYCTPGREAGIASGTWFRGPQLPGRLRGTGAPRVVNDFGFPALASHSRGCAHRRSLYFSLRTCSRPSA